MASIELNNVIKRYGVRAVVGKGGMGAKTLAALQEAGAVYLNAIGGAAQFYARRITAETPMEITGPAAADAVSAVHTEGRGRMR